MKAHVLQTIADLESQREKAASLSNPISQPGANDYYIHKAIHIKNIIIDLKEILKES